MNRARTSPPERAFTQRSNSAPRPTSGQRAETIGSTSPITSHPRRRPGRPVDVSDGQHRVQNEHSVLRSLRPGRRTLPLMFTNTTQVAVPRRPHHTCNVSRAQSHSYLGRSAAVWRTALHPGHDVIVQITQRHTCHEDPVQRPRLPRPRRARLRRPHRRRRRARPAGGSLGRADLARGRRARPGAWPPASTRSASGAASASRSSRTTAARLLDRALRRVAATAASLVPINFRLNADEIGYIVEHSGASVLLVDPELDEALADVDRAAPLRARRASPTTCSPLRPQPEPWATPDEDADRRRSTTRAARPPAPRASSSRTATCRSTPRRSAGRRASATATCTCSTCRCSTATAGAWSTRSPAWAAATSCCARSTAPRSCGASTGTA